MSDKKESAMKLFLILLSLILSIFLLLASFFIIYANEVIPDKSERKTLRETSILYNKVFLGNQVKSIAGYKNKIVTSDDKSSEFIVKWMIRIFGVFSLGFAFTLLLIPVFSNEEKDNLAIKSFKISLIIIPIFIILVNIYLFYLGGGFNLTWLFERSGGLSIIDKIFIILIIVLVFVSVGYIYYYKKKREEEAKEEKK